MLKPCDKAKGVYSTKSSIKLIHTETYLHPLQQNKRTINNYSHGIKATKYIKLACNDCHQWWNIPVHRPQAPLMTTYHHKQVKLRCNFPDSCIGIMRFQAKE